MGVLDRSVLKGLEVSKILRLSMSTCVLSVLPLLRQGLAARVCFVPALLLPVLLAVVDCFSFV